MIGIQRYTEESIVSEIEELLNLGVKMVKLFPVISQSKKKKNGIESLNKNNLICRLNKKLKDLFPELILICDIALDAYTTSGHDLVFLTKMDMLIMTKPLEILSKMALNFAKSGCDIVAPKAI